MDQEKAAEVISDDVFYMKSLVGKKVRVQTIENKFIEGIVFVIDPIYKTVVLCDDTKIRMFIYISIKSFEELSKEVVDHTFLEKPAPRDIGDWKNIEQRGEKLLKWFKTHYINARKNGETIIIDNHVSMAPPYTEETCYCKNTIILEKVRTIIGKMPEDFE
ncbi:uncharacterized protein LOC123312069 [Coccinella septempunctata]|uniref:uncharacterized protein LOC123312069 n=1 Tax=Coccinella septempunctata TaxID=41139 RepID=UPI001D08ABA7|nr:uncharacterized protein LOC123312069 [Coccinella septempunctata]